MPPATETVCLLTSPSRTSSAPSPATAGRRRALTRSAPTPPRWPARATRASTSSAPANNHLGDYGDRGAAEVPCGGAQRVRRDRRRREPRRGPGARRSSARALRLASWRSTPSARRRRRRRPRRERCPSGCRCARVCCNEEDLARVTDAVRGRPAPGRRRRRLPGTRAPSTSTNPFPNSATPADGSCRGRRHRGHPPRPARVEGTDLHNGPPDRPLARQLRLRHHVSHAGSAGRGPRAGVLGRSAPWPPASGRTASAIATSLAGSTPHRGRPHPPTNCGAGVPAPDRSRPDRRFRTAPTAPSPPPPVLGWSVAARSCWGPRPRAWPGAPRPRAGRRGRPRLRRRRHPARRPRRRPPPPPTATTTTPAPPPQPLAQSSHRAQRARARGRKQRAVLRPVEATSSWGRAPGGGVATGRPGDFRTAGQLRSRQLTAPFRGAHASPRRRQR